jgi:hypothetical protein
MTGVCAWACVRFNSFEEALLAWKRTLPKQLNQYRHIYTDCTNHSEHGLQGVESIPQRCWPMLTPKLATVVSRWLDVFWIMDNFCISPLFNQVTKIKHSSATQTTQDLHIK